MTLKRSLVLIVLQLLFVFVLGMMVVAPRTFPNPENPFEPSLAVAIFILVATIFGAVGLVWYGSVKSVGRTWRELGWHTDDLGKQLALGVVGALVCVAMTALMFAALGVTTTEILDGIRNMTLAERLTFMAIGIQAAFIEESLFRGNLLPALEKKMSGRAPTKPESLGPLARREGQRLSPSGRMRAGCLLASILLVACSGSSTPVGSVDSKGGTIKSSDGLVSVTIPAGALSEAKTITVTSVTKAGAIPGTVYSFAPDGLTFSKPVTISIKYDASNLPSGANEADLRLAQIVEPVWQGIPDSAADVMSKTVSGTVTHFSDYGVIGYACLNAPVLLDPRTPLIDVGATQVFTLRLLLGSQQVNVAPFARWRSSDLGVATITSDGAAGGIATGLATGTTTITATYGDCGITTQTVLLVLNRAAGGTDGGTDGGTGMDAGTDAGVGSGCGLGTVPDGGTFVPFDGGPGSSVTLTWTINGQPASAASCGGDLTTRVRVVVPQLDEVTGRVTYRNNGILCSTGTHTFPSVVGGCYQMRAALLELTSTSRILLEYPPAVSVEVGATPLNLTLAFTVP